jgi:hypothetical protein
MYACFKDGDYIGMEEGEDYTDSRPPNPELTITSEFQRMYGDAMPHFRYYMTPPNGAQDVWTKSVLANKRELKCIECGLVDDDKTMRIPLQCVANDPDEFSEHKDKHRERNNDVHPCTQALHVGCARWGDPSCSVRKCYYFPGHTNPDGLIVGNIDTVHCLYCRTHAENVDENHQKLVKRDEALLEKNKAAEKERLEQITQREKDRLEQVKQRTIRSTNMFQKASSMSKSRFQHKSRDSILLPSSTTHPKRPVSMLKGTKNVTKSTDNRPPVVLSKASRERGKYKNREHDRHEELDPSVALAINPGRQPTLAKRRKHIANERSIFRKEDINQLFDDLVSHGDKILRDPTSIINSRKRHWKHKLSELSTVDFDSIWISARKRFHEYQSRNANLDSSKSGIPACAELAHNATSIDFSAPSLGISTTKKVSRIKNETVELKNDLSSDGDTSAMEVDPNVSKQEEKGRSENTVNDQTSCKKFEMKHTGERPPDRWSELFIGQPFEMGYEFTLDKFEKKI